MKIGKPKSVEGMFYSMCTGLAFHKLTGHIRGATVATKDWISETKRIFEGCASRGTTIGKLQGMMKRAGMTPEQIAVYTD